MRIIFRTRDKKEYACIPRHIDDRLEWQYKKEYEVRTIPSNDFCGNFKSWDEVKAKFNPIGEIAEFTDTEVPIKGKPLEQLEMSIGNWPKAKARDKNSFRGNT